MTLANVKFVELVGYLASLWVFSTFCMKTMIPLRSVAIASNATFIAYALLAKLYPVFWLHVVLMPLNVWRLYEMRRLITRVRRASTGKFSVEPLLPFMTRAEFRQGDVLFRQGDPADKLYYPLSGSVRFPEVSGSAAPGAIFGEMGIFADDRTRTASAVFDSDSTVLVLSEQRILELYFQNPEFGLLLVPTMIRHVMHERGVSRAVLRSAA